MSRHLRVRRLTRRNLHEAVAAPTRAIRRGSELAASKVGTLGVSMLVTSIAITVYLLGRPVPGIVLLAATAVTMLFVLTERDATMVLTVFVVLLLIVPSRFVFGPIGALGTPAKLWAMAALVWWIASRLNPALGADHAPQPVRQALTIYLWWGLLTYALAFQRPLDPVEASSAHRAALTLVSLSGVTFLAMDGIASRRRLEVLLRRLVALTGVTALIGIAQYFGWDPASYLQFPGLTTNLDLVSVTERSDFARVSGTAIHAIEFGVVLATVAPFALHFALHDRTRRVRSWFWAAAILLALPTAVSRSAIVAVLVAVGLLALRWTWSQRLVAAMLAAIGMVLTRAVAPGLLGTIRALFLWWGEDDSISGRTEDFGPIYNYVSDSPLVGRGLGTFEPTVYFFLDNEWLMAAVTSGVIGVITLAVLFVVPIGCARGVVRRADDDATRHLGQAFIAALTAMIMSFGTFDGLSFNISSGLVFLLVGLAGALWRIEVGHRDRGRDADGRLRGAAPDGARSPTTDHDATERGTATVHGSHSSAQFE